MNKYIFHGGGCTQESESNETFFTEIVKNIPENGNLLLVYFAARNSDYTERIQFDSEKFRAVVNTEFTIEIATKEKFISQINNADSVYFRGGSTEKLIDTLREYPEFESALTSKTRTVAGSSAGAYALSTYFSSHYEDKISKGLGIVPVRVVTHYKSDKMPPREAAIEALKGTNTELPIIILKEAEWSIFQDK